MKTLFLGILIFQANAFAENEIKEGSLYCNTVIAIETKEHIREIQPDLIYVKTIKSDIKEIIALASAGEKEIIRVEGINSHRSFPLKKKMADINWSIKGDKRGKWSRGVSLENKAVVYKLKTDWINFVYKLDSVDFNDNGASLQRELDKVVPELNIYLRSKIDSRCFPNAENDLMDPKHDNEVNNDEVIPDKKKEEEFKKTDELIKGRSS